MTDYYGYKFVRLLDKYERDCSMQSFTVTSHPAYKEMVSMGTIIIPLVLAEISKVDTISFWTLITLLHDLTQFDLDLTEDEMGRYEIIKQKTLEWGKKNGYIR